MPLILLIRHAETDFVKKGRLAGYLAGVHLNQRGQQQAQALADKLSEAPIKAIYSSPLERAMETAAPLAQVKNLEIVPAPGLLELDCGEWQGQSLKKLRREKYWKTIQSAPSQARFPGGESFAETQLRITAELQAIAARHDPKDLLAVVSHADPIKLAVAYFLGLPLDLFQRLIVSPASISALTIGEGGGRLLTLNYDLWLSFKPPEPTAPPKAGEENKAE